MPQSVQMQRPMVVKIAVVGAGGVGKSTLIGHLATGMFIETHMTVGVNVQSMSIEIEANEQATLAMFDFGGQKQFRFMQGTLIKGSQIALLVFDCSDLQTLEQLKEWLNLLAAIPVERRLLVGTKTDMKDQIPERRIIEFAAELGIDHVIVSSKTGENMDVLFDKIRSILHEF